MVSGFGGEVRREEEGGGRTWMCCVFVEGRESGLVWKGERRWGFGRLVREGEMCLLVGRGE